jgi:hypothetical protein
MDESRASTQNPEVHHETHDVNVRAILWFAAAFVVTAIVIHVGLYFLFRGFAARERARADQPLTLVTRAERQVPPLPRLQPFPEVAPEWKGAQQHALFKTPVDDMDELRTTEDEILNSYGWVDPKVGTVRIPIQRAMELTLQRGLPVRQPVFPTTTAPPAEPTP